MIDKRKSDETNGVKDHVKRIKQNKTKQNKKNKKQNKTKTKTKQNKKKTTTTKKACVYFERILVIKAHTFFRDTLYTQ